MLDNDIEREDKSIPEKWTRKQIHVTYFLILLSSVFDDGSFDSVHGFSCNFLVTPES